MSGEELVNEEIGTENTEIEESYEDNSDKITENNDSELNNEENSKIDKGEYQPDFSFNVRNEAMEFDERLKPFITSKEVEEHVRELYTKSYGIDYLKKGLDEKSSRIEVLTTSQSKLKEEYDSMMYGFEKLDKMSKKDFTSFQKSLKISDDVILNRAAEILEYQESDQMKRSEIDRMHREKIDGYSKEDQMLNLQKQNAELQSRQHEFAWSQTMIDPSVNEFKSKFDERMGEGAFEGQVRDFGSMVWHREKKYIQPIQAVNAIMGKYKSLFGSDQITVQEPLPTNKTQAPKPIPNLGSGKTANPTKRKFNSIEEMRKYGEELHRQELLRQYD